MRLARDRMTWREVELIRLDQHAPAEFKFSYKSISNKVKGSAFRLVGRFQLPSRRAVIMARPCTAIRCARFEVCDNYTRLAYYPVVR